MPVIERVRNDYDQRLKVELLLGGLRCRHRASTASSPATTDHRSLARRASPDWTAVSIRARNAGRVHLRHRARQSRSGCRFEAQSGCDFAFFRAIQSAFYVEQRNVTQASVLSELAVHVGLEAQAFLDAFESQVARDITQSHFHKARQLGVHGFPTLIGQQAIPMR